MQTSAYLPFPVICHFLDLSEWICLCAQSHFRQQAATALARLLVEERHNLILSWAHLIASQLGKGTASLLTDLEQSWQMLITRTCYCLATI